MCIRDSLYSNLAAFRKEFSLANCLFPKSSFRVSFSPFLYLSSEKALESSITCFTVSAPPQVQTDCSCPYKRCKDVRVPNSQSSDANLFTMTEITCCLPFADAVFHGKEFVLTCITHLLPHIINSNSFLQMGASVHPSHR